MLAMTLAGVKPMKAGLRWCWSADPRALGIFRVALGLLALWDVARRVPYITVFYSDAGVLPGNGSLLGATRPEEVALFFALAAFCLLCFTIGWRTKLFHVLGAVSIWSIHGHDAVLQSATDVVLDLWLLWTLFLPLGRRLSADALLRSLTSHDDKTPAAIALRPAPPRTPVGSLAVTAVILQLVLIFISDVDLGAPTVWVAVLLLVPPRGLDLLRRGLRRLAGPPIVVFFDSDCGVCTLCARIGARMDRLELTTWVGREREGPPGIDDFDALRERTIVVWSPSVDRIWTEAAAVARVVRALPLGRLVAWTLRLPGPAHTIDAGYRWFSPRRHVFSAWIGLGVCGVDATEAAPRPPAEPSEAARWWGGARRLAAELTVLLLLAWATVHYDRPLAREAPTDGEHVDPQTGGRPRPADRVQGAKP